MTIYFRISAGPNCPEPNCLGPNLPLFKGGQLGPVVQLSGAQFATFLGRTVGPRTTGPRGPNVHFFWADSWAQDNFLGPNCPGPNLPRTQWTRLVVTKYDFVNDIVPPFPPNPLLLLFISHNKTVWTFLVLPKYV